MIQRTCGYDFDKAGNRNSMTDSIGPSHSYSITDLNQYTTDGTAGGAITNGNEHEIAVYQQNSYSSLAICG